MPLSPLRVPGRNIAMEIRFCSICQESIPDGEFDTGRAIQVGRKSQHVACGLKHAAEVNGPRSWVTSLLALYAAGVATFFLVSTLGKTEETPTAPEVPEVVVSSITDAVQDSEARQVKLLEERLARTETKIERAFAEKTLKTWNDRVRGDIRKLDDRMTGYNKSVHDRMSSVDGRLTAAEKNLDRLMDWFQRIQTQADQIEKELTAARNRPAEPAKATPAPVEDADQPAPTPAVDPEHEALLAKWLKALKDSNSEIVFTATIELGKLKDLRAAEPLVKVLKTHKDLWPRLGAGTSLGDLRAVEAVPALIDALQDREELVRSAAANALRSITEQDFEYIPGLSRAERGRIQKAYGKWWKSNEAGLRTRLNQPKS